MIFYYQGTKKIFIHIPKTGGNTIQATFIKNKITEDFKIKVMKNQDGIDRFDIKGTETERKHQSLHSYISKHPYMVNLEVFSAVRDPFERLISFYFAPFNHARIDSDSGKTIFPSTIVFDERKFMSLVARIKTAAEWLSICKKDIQVPKNIKLINTKNLEQDFNMYFPDLQLSPRLNASPYIQEANAIRDSMELRRLVENSKHSIDYRLFF